MIFRRFRDIMFYIFLIRGHSTSIGFQRFYLFIYHLNNAIKSKHFIVIFLIHLNFIFKENELKLVLFFGNC